MHNSFCALIRRRTIPMFQAMRAWAGRNAGYGCETKHSWREELIIKRKWKDIVPLKQRFQSNRNNPFAIRPKFWLLLSKVGLEKKIFRRVTGSFGRIGPTVKKDYLHIWRSTTLTGKFLRRTKRSIFLDQNFRKLWYNGQHPMLYLIPERDSLLGGAFPHTVGYYI